MNFLLAITDKAAGLPIWAWIVIGVVVLAAIIIIALVAVKLARARKDDGFVEEDGIDEDFSDDATDDATDDEDEEDEEEEKAPAAQTAVKTEPAAKPAQPAQKPAAQTQKPAAQPAQKPAQPAARTAAQPATTSEEAAQIAEAAKYNGLKVYHITKRKADGKWQIKFNNGKKAIKLFDTQVQAIDYAKALAQNQEASIMIHKEDGTFRKLRYDKPNK